MTFRNTRHRRLLAAAAIVAAGIVAQPRQAAAQFVVFDPASLGQAVVDQVTRAAQLVQQAPRARRGQSKGWSTWRPRSPSSIPPTTT